MSRKSVSGCASRIIAPGYPRADAGLIGEAQFEAAPVLAHWVRRVGARPRSVMSHPIRVNVAFSVEPLALVSPDGHTIIPHLGIRSGVDVRR